MFSIQVSVFVDFRHFSARLFLLFLLLFFQLRSRRCQQFFWRDLVVIVAVLCWFNWWFFWNFWRRFFSTKNCCFYFVNRLNNCFRWGRQRLCLIVLKWRLTFINICCFCSFIDISNIRTSNKTTAWFSVDWLKTRDYVCICSFPKGKKKKKKIRTMREFQTALICDPFFSVLIFLFF